METLLPRSHEETLPHDLLGGVVRELEIVDAGVDGGVGAVAGLDLAHDRQAWEQVRQAA